MSAAAPTVDASAAAPAKKGKKKLIVIIAVALAVLLGAGAATVFMLKKKSVTAQSDEETASGSEHTAAKFDAKHPPTFLPLEPFVVNLADRDADRYAQIGITMELSDAKFAEEMKVYMPAIRNGILMILAHKDSHELLERTGKERLARQIRNEAARTMGLEVGADADDLYETRSGADAASPAGTKLTPGASRSASTPTAAHAPAPAPAHDTASDDDEPAPKAKGPATPAKLRVENPIRHVHFSNFIIQ